MVYFGGQKRRALLWEAGRSVTNARRVQRQITETQTGTRISVLQPLRRNVEGNLLRRHLGIVVTAELVNERLLCRLFL